MKVTKELLVRIEREITSKYALKLEEVRKELLNVDKELKKEFNDLVDVEIKKSELLTDGIIKLLYGNKTVSDGIRNQTLIDKYCNKELVSKRFNLEQLNKKLVKERELEIEKICIKLSYSKDYDAIKEALEEFGISL